MTERFAIYFAPSATSNLWERAATWLGRDASNGELFSGTVAGIDRDRLLNLTQSANRYGFHATLKAPMALIDGATDGDGNKKRTIEDHSAPQWSGDDALANAFDHVVLRTQRPRAGARIGCATTERQCEYCKQQ